MPSAPTVKYLCFLRTVAGFFPSVFSATALPPGRADTLKESQDKLETMTKSLSAKASQPPKKAATSVVTSAALLSFRRAAIGGVVRLRMAATKLRGRHQ